MARYKVLYKNYRGEVQVRDIELIKYYRGYSHFYGTQELELMYVWDYDKEDFRDFAVKNILEWL